MKLFVSGFSEDARIGDLLDLFTDCGRVSAIRMCSGQKRCYAIVEMPFDDQATKAIWQVDGKQIDGEQIQVRESQW
jgi:hypothetical protein